jgi:hypothetical protein
MVLNLPSLQITLSTKDGERGTKIPHQIFMDEELRLKNTHQELVATFGADAYGRPQIKAWLHKFRNGDLFCDDTPRTGRPLLTLGSQFAAFLQKYPFASA